jgi:V/A-type H+-transporting ATPase subunit E
MTDQVQHLIDRIRQDAVQAADRQSQELLAQARAQADALLAQGRAAAAQHQREAEQQAARLVEQGTRSLQQAARDVLLKVGERVEDLVREALAAAVDAALRPQVVEEMLLRLADGFAKNGVVEGQLALTVGPEDKERLTRLVMDKVREKLEQGVTVSIDPRLGRGFRLSYAGGAVHHDFTGEAIANALAGLLRPNLAEIVMRAALSVAPAGKP